LIFFSEQRGRAMSVTFEEIIADPIEDAIRFFETLPRDEEIYMLSNRRCAVSRYFQHRTGREVSCGRDCIRFADVPWDEDRQIDLPLTHWTVLLQDLLELHATPQEIINMLVTIKRIKVALHHP
jgi:hypothetical protein